MGVEMEEVGGDGTEAAMEDRLVELVNLFDSGEVKGGQEAFEAAREELVARGRLPFNSWMDRVRAELGVDEVEQETYRSFYDRKLSPSEAVLEERLAAGVLEG